nr:unnamed protein product [Spirometra erinaceieuropaei]
MPNIARKIFARILLNRLNHHLEQGLLLESQCGFRRHRGTTDMIFGARQLQEKCQAMRTYLYSIFMDLTRGYASTATRRCLRRCAVQQQVVDDFTCLGSTLSRTTNIDDEVAHRISKVSPDFGRLQNTEV